MCRRKRGRGEERKGKRDKDKPCKIYIITEGRTENIYLKHYDNKKYRVQIIPVDTEHTNAKGIVTFAKAFIDKEKIDIELGDRCYCVFDSDPDSNPDIKTPIDWINGYKHKGLDCIFSNPSFEVWFVLHFKNPPYGKNAVQMKSTVKKLVKDEFPDYSETTDIFDYLSDKQVEALKKARLLHKTQQEVHKNVYSHECNPFTNIFEFIDYIESVKVR